MVLGAITGSVIGQSAAGPTVQGLLDFIGTLFIIGLKMLVVPLVCSSLIVGVSGIGSARRLGRLGLRTLLYFLVTSLVAVVLGTVLVDLVRPGELRGEAARDLLALESSGAEIASEIADQNVDNLMDILLGIVPTNVISAAAGDDLLGLAFFSIVFGFFMARLDHSYADPMFRFWSGISQVMMRITSWLMAFAPIGVFGLVAGAVSRLGADALGPLAGFVAVVLLAMAAHVVITLPVLLRSLAGVSPLAFYRVAAPVALTAFSAASSLAALPVAIERIEKNAGISNRVATIALSFGAVLNLNGSALYNCAAAVFLAQAYGVQLDLVDQFMIVTIGIVASVGVGASPAASLLAIAFTLSAIGVPAEAVGVLFVVDRLMEMARAGMNVVGDMACAVMVAQAEGESTSIASRPQTPDAS
jgi:Na+/H+-dicarboxylate symporter